MDHFLFLGKSKEIVKEAGVLRSHENMSDHEPIFGKIEVNKVDFKLNDAEENQYYKFQWKRATSDQKLEYNDVIFRRLLNRKVPGSVENCTDVTCKDSNHIRYLDDYVQDILTDISDSGFDTIPIK